MVKQLITAKSVLEDTIYRAGSTIVNIRPEGMDHRTFEAGKRIESKMEAILCYDVKMNIVWANEYAYRLFNITSEQIKTAKCYEIVSKRLSHCAVCPVMRTIETGNEYEEKLVSTDGRVVFVRSYPLKDENGRVNGVIEVIKDILKNTYHQDITDAYTFGGRIARLTDREREVMQLVAEGMQNKAIGTKLGISSKTVEIHRARVMDKLQTRSTAQLVRYLTKYEIFGNYLTE
jgi:DNA-binding CsgD family transcriptional regulator